MNAIKLVLRNAPLLSKVVFDTRLQIDQRALGTLTAVSRVQGGQLKAKREIRVAAVFKEAPAAMLDMMRSAEMQEIGIHRAAGLAGQLNIETVNAGGLWLDGPPA